MERILEYLQLLPGARVTPASETNPELFSGIKNFIKANIFILAGVGIVLLFIALTLRK